MTTSVIISLVSLFLVWGSALIALWIKLNVRLAEIEIKQEQRYMEFKEHCRWGQEQQAKNENKFEHISAEVKESHKELLSKVDYLIEKLNNLAVYVEKQNK